MKRKGVYPGSFNPPTAAHLSIARRAIQVHGLTQLDIVLSRSALGKESVCHPHFEDRCAVVKDSFADIDQVTVRVTNLRLLSEICEDYDLAILGSDKWQQIQELKWYDDDDDRRRQLDRLPPLTIVERGTNVPKKLRLDIDQSLVSNISSTNARSGAVELMTPAAAHFAEVTGAWIEPERYDRWRKDLGEHIPPTASS